MMACSEISLRVKAGNSNKENKNPWYSPLFKRDFIFSHRTFPALKNFFVFRPQGEIPAVEPVLIFMIILRLSSVWSDSRLEFDHGKAQELRFSSVACHRYSDYNSKCNRDNLLQVKQFLLCFPRCFYGGFTNGLRYGLDFIWIDMHNIVPTWQIISFFTK